MGSKWRKVKVAFGMNLCVYAPKNLVADNDDDDESLPPSGAALISPPPMPASIKLSLSKSFSRSSSKKTCSICLASMRRGDGQALFTAECSHSFHFQCIASNVKHGNRICPVCRAKWKEIPLQGPNPHSPPGRPCMNPVGPRANNPTTLVRRLPPPRSNSSRNATPLFQPPEPAVFNDDESLDHLTGSTETDFSSYKVPSNCKVNIKTYTEVPAVPKSSSVDSFTVLIHLKAPLSNSWHNISKRGPELLKISPTPRAAVDLVTVLDISGSMAGTKLALLNRAMGFLIQNLGPNDRLAVISFSSTAQRLFPLGRMTETGQQQSLQAVNSLVASDGTNIAEGLRKGAKIMEDRREKNPVSSIILLSDGQDIYTINSAASSNSVRNPPRYEMLLPSSVRPDGALGFKTPVHTFGFGTDHDAASMHSISEMSGGTFSFIEAEGVIQDAFAQCIGGLLSVVVKDLRVSIECVDPNIRLVSLKAGSFPSRTLSDQRMGSIDVGHLYADEERDFLLVLNVPAEVSSCETSLLKVKCVYNDPLMKELVTLDGEQVQIQRTDVARLEDVSIEVDRQKNRIQAAEAMAKARAAAENGDLGGAVFVLGDVRKVLSGTVSSRSNDRLCLALDAELKEMQERMASRHVYEASGRSYILSGLSSHSWQRATARGESIDGSSLVRAYETPSMVEMVTRSQASLVGSPSGQRLLRPLWSFGSQPRPRLKDWCVCVNGDTPLLERFVNGDDAFRNSRFKLIPHISQGSWIVKQSVGRKACLVGQALEINYFRGNNYLEIGVDVGSSTVAVVSLVLGYLNNLAIEMAFLIQGNTSARSASRNMSA